MAETWSVDRRYFFRMIMKSFKFLGIMMMLVMGMSFASCSDNDDSTSLIGRSFRGSDSYLDYAGYPETWETTLTFTSSSKVTDNSKGSSYYYENNKYKKENWSTSNSYSYSVSGNKITIRDYPDSGENKVFTYNGSYLKEGNTIYYEVK